MYGRGPDISGPNVSHHTVALDARALAVFRTALRDQSRCVRHISARMIARERPTWAATEFDGLSQDADASLRETGLLGLGDEDSRTSSLNSLSAQAAK